MKELILCLTVLFSCIGFSEPRRGGGYSYDRSIELLQLAKQQLLVEIDTLQSKAFIEVPQRREILREAIQNMDVPNNVDDLVLLRGNFDGFDHMFYFQSSPSKIIVFESFYTAYAGTSPEMYNIDVIEVKRRLVHESSHIWGFTGDEQARKFAFELFPLAKKNLPILKSNRYRVSVRAQTGLVATAGLLHINSDIDGFRLTANDASLEKRLFRFDRKVTTVPSSLYPDQDSYRRRAAEQQSIVFSKEMVYTKESGDSNDNCFLNVDVEMGYDRGIFKSWVDNLIGSLVIEPTESSATLIVIVDRERITKRIIRRTSDNSYSVTDDNGERTIRYTEQDSFNIIQKSVNEHQMALSIKIDRL